MSANLAEILQHFADREPDRRVVSDETESLTWAELRDRSATLAAGLSTEGVGRGDVVAVLMRNSTMYLTALFASSWIGAVLLPVNWRLSPTEWSYLLGDAEAAAVLTDAEFLDALRAALPASVGDRVFLTTPGSAADRTVGALIGAHRGQRPPMVALPEGALQRLMYTSGTTSHPKGVCLSHGNVAWKNFAQIIEFGLGPDDVVLSCGPLYHVGGLDLPALSALHAGGRMVILRQFDVTAVLAAIERERATIVWLAPAMMRLLLDAPELREHDVSSLRLIIGGGEKMPEVLVERIRDAFPGAWFADAYGLTETVGGDTFNDHDHMLSKVGSVGRPVPHLGVRIVDAAGNPLTAGELGEIALRGPKVFAGYWRNPEATAAAIRDGWFHTGDVGRLDADGYLYVEDRRKDMIISGGENIASPEVERVVYEHPEVIEAAVVAHPHEKWGEVPKAFVVRRPGSALSADELRAFCADRLARFKVPAEVEFLDELPRNATGKVRKNVLRGGVGA